MKAVAQSYKTYFKNRQFVGSFVLSFVLLIIALFISFYAGVYATRVASAPVTDLILSNIRVYDVDGIFIYGPWVFWILLSGYVFLKPFKIPFIVKSIALFLVIRSVFISLTHIGPFPNEVVMSSTRLISDFSAGGDLFFSAHTGLPFLMALVFWDHKILRWVLVATAVFFGVVVLLGHLHYSIDVLSAFFITYSIYHIAEVFFKKDKEFFDADLITNK